MKLRYNDKTGSLQYLVTDEEPARSKCFLKPFYCIRDACSQLSTDRVILLSALIMSTVALILSCFNTTHLLLIEEKKEMPKTSAIVQHTPDRLAMNVSTLTPAMEDLHPSAFSNTEELELTTAIDSNRIEETTTNKALAPSPQTDELAGGANSSEEPSPTKLDGIVSLEDVVAVLDVLNESFWNMEQVQNQKLQELNDKVEHYIVNEATDIRNEMDRFLEWQSDITQKVNLTLSELEDHNTQDDKSANAQKTTEGINSYLNRSTLDHLRQQIERLNNTVTEQSKQKLGLASVNEKKLLDMGKVVNQTKIGLRKMLGRILNINTDMTRNLQNLNSRITFLSSQNNRQFQIKFSTTDGQLRSIKSTLQRLQVNHTATALKLEGEIQKFGTDVGLESTNLANTQMRIEKLENKFTEFNSDSVRDRARISAWERKSVTLSTSLEEIKDSLKGKADEGWIQAANGYSYHISQRLFKSWFTAGQYCENMNATLAYHGPNNGAMKNFLFKSIVEPRGTGAWIGLSDLEKEGRWKWIDGNPLDYVTFSNWAPGQPNSYHGEQDCGEIDSSAGKWNDLWCILDAQSYNAALCEKIIQL